MQKILFLVISFVLVGFGCIKGLDRDERWLLSFKLPETWAMYGSGIDGYIANPITEINKETNEVVLQNTKDAIFPVYSGSVKEGETQYNGENIKLKDYTYIRVFQLDERRVIPKDAEKLKKGFFKVKECEKGEVCTERNAHNETFYYQKGEDKYKFVIYSDEGKEQEAIDIILSAKAVSIEQK